MTSPFGHIAAVVLALGPTPASAGPPPHQTLASAKGDTPAAAKGPGGGKGPQAGRPLGRFLLSERPVGPWVPDDIEFHEDGSCTIDNEDRGGPTGECRVLPDGRLSVGSGGTPRDSFASAFRLLNTTLQVSQEGGSDLLYVRAPKPPHPSKTEILGITWAHSALGDSAGELSADHTFRVHLIDLIPADHTYYDIQLSGAYVYDDGVITYFIERSNAPEKLRYIRDFVIKRDKSCLWIVDPFHDAPLCETPATNLDLPAPPEGYKPAKRP